MRENVNSKLLAVVMITGLILSSSTVFLGHAVFADDPWSSIQARQVAAEQKAMAKYMSYYQFTNLDQSKRNWDGLTSTSTDENSRGRQIDAQSQVSADNGVKQFNAIHVLELAKLQRDYSGITSTPTDTQGRDRNAMIDNAKAISQVNADDVINQLVKIQQKYANFAPSVPTDTAATYDRQTTINQNWDSQEKQARDLVSLLAQKDQVYVDLDKYIQTGVFAYRSTTVTNEMTHGGRQISAQQEQALQKAVMIFNEIHQQHLAYLNSHYYGLTSTPTDTNGRDRNQMLQQAQQSSLDNAIRIYNSYYNPAGNK